MPVTPSAALAQVRPHVHARGVEPDEERLAALGAPRRRTWLRRGVDLLIDGLHPLAGERTGVLDLLAALAVAPRVQHAARAVLLPELGILRVVVGLRLLLGVQVVEVAEELVEAVHRRQVRVAVAEMVLAELAGGVALLLQQVGDRRRPVGDALRRTRHADGQQAGAERMLAEDERRAAGRAALLGVGVGEERALLRDAVDVGRLVAHARPGCRR